MHEITPPADESITTTTAASADVPQELYLDTNTDKGGDLSLTEIFAPPVGVYKRSNVFPDLYLKNNQLFFVQRPPQNCKKYKPAAPATNRTTHRSALVYLHLSSHHIRLPGDSPEMQITSFSAFPADSHNPGVVTLLKCRDDDFFITASHAGLYRIEFDTASPTDSAIPKTADFFQNAVPGKQAISDDLAGMISQIERNQTELARIHQSEHPLSNLIRFFQSFESSPLSSQSIDDMNKQRPDNAGLLLDQNKLNAIISEKKGICRHRAFAFAWIANSWGYNTRIVVNEVHAFIEIFYQNHWYPVELGGSARSLTTKPASFTAPAKIQNEVSFLDLTVSHNPQANTAVTTVTAPGNIHSSTRNGGLYPQQNRTLPYQSAGFRFRPENCPSNLLRDQETTISGFMLDAHHMPIKNHPFVLECSHPQKKSIVLATFKTDETGHFSIWVKTPPDWPLGHSDMRWLMKTDTTSEPKPAN